jgi:hypothetical protein
MDDIVPNTIPKIWMGRRSSEMLPYNVFKTKSSRKTMIDFVIALIQSIIEAEQTAVDNITENFQTTQRVEEANDSIESLYDAITCLGNAY